MDLVVSYVKNKQKLAKLEQFVCDVNSSTGGRRTPIGMVIPTYVLMVGRPDIGDNEG